MDALIPYDEFGPRAGSPDRKLLVAPKKGEQEFDDVISDYAQYGRIQFWDERYLNDLEPFEWF